MFTEQDILTLKKVRNSFYQRRSEDSQSSSAPEHKSEDELYYSRYFLNSSLKIILIEIVGIEEVGVSSARFESYMVYRIKVMTEDYSYEVRRRYSEFLKLYESVLSYELLKDKTKESADFQQFAYQAHKKSDYVFPLKKISSSLRNFFNISSKQKLAEERKHELCSFLNQIRNNYSKRPKQFADDYIELLKFIDMKQQHQKFWKQKEGRFLELSNSALKDMQLIGQPKPESKAQDNVQPINIEHLSELLQHQMNKINLAILARNSVTDPTTSLSSLSGIAMHNDPMITDQIIKNVDCIRDIVLEMKRRINLDYTRCILKGKDIKDQGTSSPGSVKKGLVEFAIKFAQNELVIIHILKMVLNVFLNSEINYSCELFCKVLAELDSTALTLSEEKEQLAISSIEFREVYFKIVKQFFLAKEQFGTDKKLFLGSEKNLATKMMGLMLYSIYQKWSQKCQKNRQFKLKDEQKQWMLVIENLPRKYVPRKSEQILQRRAQVQQIQSAKKSASMNYQNAELIKMPTICKRKQGLHRIRNCKNSNIEAYLQIQKSQLYDFYQLSAIIFDMDYKNCVQIMRKQQNWNDIILNSEVDIYSNTKKERILIPGKQQKMFRFVEEQQIQMNLEEKEIERQTDVHQLPNFIALGVQDEVLQQSKGHDNPKMSTQTMPSINGSCAHDHQPEQNSQQLKQDLARSRLSQCINFKKSPPREGKFNSYSQEVKIERVRCHGGKADCCLVQVQIMFQQPTARRYFQSEVSGETDYIWRSFLRTFDQGYSDDAPTLSAS